MFGTVLIANRGEIALRVARTCRELGVQVVAVHSTADRDSAVVRFADRSVQIGPASPRHSYLNAAAIVEAALSTGADAIHPGYGFLSENPDFAEICASNDITFVGPPPQVLAALGDKSVACERMAGAGLPVVPGDHRTLTDAGDAADVAARVGYPVILKPSAGGGGKGMAVVRRPREMARAFTETRAAAQAVFNDGSLYLERYVEGARHVEVQVMADHHGNVVHVGARDCSVQRRHQKLLEESPPPGISPTALAEMAAAAVTGAAAVGYVGAGTFEFVVDPDDRFYFMEINCRVQVEHPVTEMVSGIDIVREQLRASAGEPLSFRQDDIELRGAAIECRINAEDPDRGFVPTPGRLEEFAVPGGPFTRVDTHARPGIVVTPDYDSLLAKVVVWAPDRPQAIARMDRALSEVVVRGAGMHSTAGFLRGVLAQPDFVSGRYDTNLVAGMTEPSSQAVAPGKTA